MKSDVARIVAAEWLKLRHRRTTVVVPAAVCVMTVVIFFALELAARARFTGLPSGFHVTAATLDLTTSLVLLLIAVVGTCFHISREFALGTAKSAWTRPLTRRAWYSGKVLSAGMAISGLFVLTVMIVIVLAAWRFGFTDLMEKDYLVHSAGNLWWRMALAFALTLWGLWAVVSVVAALAALFNHPGGAIAAALGLGILFTILGMFSAIAPFLLSTCVSLPLDQLAAMSQGLSLPQSWGQTIWRSLFGGGIWMSAAWAIGLGYIGRKEITS